MKKFLTSLLCIVATLCFCLGLTACGNGEETVEIVLTAETDFSALVSEKVDENGWKQAMSLKDYNVNFTNYIIYDNESNDIVYTIKYNVNEMFYAHSFFEASIKKEADKTISYYYYDYDLEEGIIQKTKENEGGYDSFDDMYKLYMVMYYPDFSANFSSFTYDETTHSYVCKSIKGNELFNYDGGDYAPDNTTYNNIEVKIINGRLAYWSSNQLISKFFDFGNTVISYKDAQEVTDALE